MRFGVCGRYKRNLSHGAALLLMGSLAAGCSSGVSRFTGDDFVTNSTTPNQQAAMGRAAPVDDYAVSSNQPSSGGVTRGALPPVSGQSTRVASAAPMAAKPRIVSPDPDSVANKQIDPLSRTMERAGERDAGVKVSRNDPAGWSSAGGSQVTAKDGETVFNLSRRYGVPADVLMKVNGISESGGLRTGQKVIIPTYIYTDRNPVSAPDNNPKVAAAKSSRGNKPTETEIAAAKPKAGKGTYTVASGETLNGIAHKHGVSAAALRQANGLEDGNIKIGQTLKIPSGGSATIASTSKTDPVKTASTLPPAKEKLAATSPAKVEPAAYTPPVKSKAITAVEDENDDTAPSSTGIDRMRWPVKGRVVSGYGKGAGTSRDGIDIQVPEGTPVKAAENGVVIYAGDGLKDFGNTVLVRHENGLVTVYGHAEKLNVKRGQKVKRGDQIATSGMSGATQSPKLHFEVRKDSTPVDPSTYLE